ncbi:MAG: TfoX/Sxy family DNA transformation protein [Ignavibacteria bacterium]|jgi:DNA transformation protein
MKTKKSEITKLRNLGPTSEKLLNSIDVYTLDDIKELTPVVIFHILKSRGYNVTLNMVYALQGAIMDLHYLEVPEDIKKELKEEIERTK